MKKTVTLASKGVVVAIQKVDSVRTIMEAPIATIDFITNSLGVLAIKATVPDTEGLSLKFEVPVATIPSILDALHEIDRSLQASKGG